MSTEMDQRPVRTYRGRSLEELIPKIRAELGPDAIILREREGLTGGFNGFFQQRCVEVDAQAAPVKTMVDFYDDDDAALPGDEPQPAPVDDSAQTTEFSAPSAAPATPGGWPHERVAAPAPATPATPAAETPAPEEPAEPSPYAGAAQTYAASSYAAPPVEPSVEPGPETPAVEATPAPAPPVQSDELSFAQRLAQARQEREAARVEPEPEPEPEPEAQAPADPAPVAEEPALARGNLRIVDAPREPAGASVTPIPSAASREPRLAPPTPRPFPPASTGAAGGELDSAAAGAIARELTGQGISESWAHELVVTAAAHLTPFTPGGGLRAGVRAVIAGGITAPPPLPSTGAAVAFVGPGGSGKSRCSAALASAYRRASTLQTHVVSLGSGPRSADVAGLLAERDIPVDLLRGAAAADAIARGRERGMVIVDTDTTSPVDAQGVAALADTLEPLGLDAIYLTLPATMSAPAARGLLDGLEALRPSALVITHADEATELGIVAELAYLSGLPIAFIHGGLNIDTALVATDPAGIAARVLL